MNYISKIVKDNKAVSKKKICKKVSKRKPLLILYKSQDLVFEQIFICLPEDELKLLKQSSDFITKGRYERIVITKRNEGWLANITLTMPKFVL